MATTTGMIFDIQRFALHDGPGIRTTVFFKGCPLRCIWCHNPESQDFRPQLSFDRERCTNCFKCVHACPTGAHYIKDGKHCVNYDKCELNGKCTMACPNDALKIIGREWTTDEVMAVVMRDWDYYRNSGGGITLSGGEPMSQPGFALELLKTAKAEGLHTCVDTSGFARQEDFEKVLQYTDLFLFDYKASEPEIHKYLTGASNEIILENLDFLYRNNARIILRCPLIKGINDSREHLEGIARTAGKYPGLAGIEIMAYHNMGFNKAAKIGRKPAMEVQPNTDDRTKADWIAALNALGCTNVKIG